MFSFWNKCGKVLMQQMYLNVKVVTFSSQTSASYDLSPFKLHKLEKGPNEKATITQEDACKYYKEMLVIRRMETAAGNLYKEKLIRGFCHLSSGQEACCVGIKAAMQTSDVLISAYRIHGWTYMMGIPVAGVLSELTGRISGCAQGKGGSMHMYGENFYGGHGIVGAQIPIGAGISLAMKYLETDNVCITLYGDGAANQGQVFEAYNMAKLWDLPCVFVCENNCYGMTMRADKSSANTDYYLRGDYIPGIYVNGMDVLAVREASKYALNFCRSGKGPIILECATYRFHGHSMSDPGTGYRSREEIQTVREHRDPITGFKDRLLQSNLATEDQLSTIEQDVQKEIEEAVKHAKTDPEPALTELYTHVYKTLLPNFKIRGVDPFTEVDPATPPQTHKIRSEGPNMHVNPK